MATMSRILPRVLTAMIVAAAGACSVEDASRGAHVADREHALRIRLDEVEREDFLLVLDEAAPSVTLFLGRVPLQRYEVLSVERARRRLLFVPLPSGSDPAAILWRGVVQDPPAERKRRELAYTQPDTGADADAEDGDESPDPAPAASRVPPTPEQAVPAPDRWVLRVEGGPELRFEGVGPDTAPPVDDGAVGRWGVVGDWIRGNDPTPRLRIRMPLAHVHALYRSLPTDAALLIVPAR